MSILSKILLIIICLFVAATGKAVADRIGWANLFAKFKFWSRQNTGTKDKNQDGKATKLEQFFPVDGWHLMEWLRILPFSFYLSIDLCKNLPIQVIFKGYPLYDLFNYWFMIYVCVPIIITASYNFIFLVVYGLLPRIINK